MLELPLFVETLVDRHMLLFRQIKNYVINPYHVTRALLHIAFKYMEVVPKNMAKETVSKMWVMCTVPRYKPAPKTKKYFVIPKSKSSKKKSNK